MPVGNLREDGLVPIEREPDADPKEREFPERKPGNGLEREPSVEGPHHAELRRRRDSAGSFRTRPAKLLNCRFA